MPFRQTGGDTQFDSTCVGVQCCWHHHWYHYQPIAPSCGTFWVVLVNSRLYLQSYCEAPIDRIRQIVWCRRWMHFWGEFDLHSSRMSKSIKKIVARTHTKKRYLIHTCCKNASIATLSRAHEQSKCFNELSKSILKCLCVCMCMHSDGGAFFWRSSTTSPNKFKKWNLLRVCAFFLFANRCTI